MEPISMANKNLQDAARSYKILRDPTRFYGIVDKNAMESISVGKKILQDPTKLNRIRDKNAMESISIAKKMLQDSTGYLRKILWNPYE